MTTITFHNGDEKINLPTNIKNFNSDVVEYLCNKYVQTTNLHEKSVLIHLLLKENITNELKCKILRKTIPRMNGVSKYSYIVVDNNIVTMNVFSEKLDKLIYYHRIPLTEVKDVTIYTCNQNIYLFTQNVNKGFMYCVNKSKIVISENIYKLLTNPVGVGVDKYLADFKSKYDENTVKFLLPYFMKFIGTYQLIEDYCKHIKDIRVVDISPALEICECSMAYIKDILGDNDATNIFIKCYKDYKNNEETLYSVTEYKTNGKIDDNNIIIDIPENLEYKYCMVKINLVI